ncbi:MAG: PSD1 domain-containing protein [Planctomycetes bacterium]|nr:PSD1 domain-containing protein [Planctomycetota bacterium]
MLQRRSFLAVLAGFLLGTAFLPTWAGELPAPAGVAKRVHFEADVVPILRAYCWKCHGGEGRAAGLDMRSLPLLLAGGKSGPAVNRGSADKSLLYRKLASGQMPPGNGLKPTKAHLATLRTWLDTGAAAKYEGGPLTKREAPPLKPKDRNWWAFRKPISPRVPSVRSQDRVRTPIDAFLLRRLEEKGLSFSPDADRLMLVRRVYHDLIGLPPSPQEVDAFLNDSSPDAYEKLIERLLASPHYGERWGRHWLDAAGYVDTIATDNDAAIITEREGIWKYRDYVIRSYNQDNPFDRFLLEQLAGDELVDWRNAAAFTPEIKELLTATGFLRQASDVTYAAELNTSDIRHQVLFDTVQIVTSNLLGLTVHCAQCHSHKFDPISQADYYRLAAFFAPAYDPQNWKHSNERVLFDVSAHDKQAIDANNAEVDRQVAELRKQIAALRHPLERKLFEAKLATLPDSIRVDTKNALEMPAERRNVVQKYLAEKLGPLLKVTPAEVDRVLDEAVRRKITALNKRVVALTATKHPYDKIQALWDLGPPPRTFLYRRGDYQMPGAEVRPGVPAVLDDPAQPFALPVPSRGSPTNGYRAALARWLTRPEHPLTARVFVNRVWQHYFGQGMVATPDNFGASGASPSHPELLDWLATEFAGKGWSIKHLHRLIVSSTAYRQSSVVRPHTTDSGKRLPDDPESVDPDNRLLWRMPLRRLESEIVRDSILAVSGVLDRTQGGPPVPLKPNPDGSVEIDIAKLPTPTSQFRRSLYLFNRRNYQLTELGVFDQPVVAHNCTRRTSTAVVLQSLTMLNSPFVFSQAERLAQRVKQAAGADPERRIETAFRLSLCRWPGKEEVSASRALLTRQARRYQQQKKAMPLQAADAALVNLCQMLLNTNEFLYIP